MGFFDAIKGVKAVVNPAASFGTSDFGRIDPSNQQAFWARDELVRRWGYRDLVQFQRVLYSFLKHWGTPTGQSLRHFMWDNSRAQPAMLGARERKEREMMNARVAGNAELVAPVEGVSLDDYARACLGAASGNFAAVLAELGMDMAKYERVAAGWNAKMAADTTGTVARFYGEAFTRAR
jgi:hypothetical protein